MLKVLNEYTNEPHLLRATLLDCMIDAAKNDPRIVAMDADCAASSGFGAFAKAYPERFFNCGIAEANMVGIAAGLSATGKIPFIHAFGIFASRRVCDQVFLSGCYSDANIRIIGTDPGITAAYNGGTHMPFEDMAVLRAIPNIKLIEVTDSVMLKGIFDELVNERGVFYIRLKRKNTPAIFEAGSQFKIGQACLLKEGTDVSLIASGIMVVEALNAARLLEAQGISARVVNMHTWKPLDTAMVVDCATHTRAIVTAENHNVLGGLGGAVCEAVCAAKPCPVERVGINDEFGEVGTEDFLRGRFALTAERIAEAAKTALSRA